MNNDYLEQTGIEITNLYFAKDQNKSDAKGEEEQKSALAQHLATKDVGVY